MSNKSTTNRLLRVGLVLGGRIVEERLFREGGAVTIAAEGRATFLVPTLMSLDRFTVFEHRSEGVVLRIDAEMSGRAFIGGERRELRPRGCNGLLEVPLDAAARGRIDIGPAALLFQMVDAPPIGAATPLPAVMRRRLEGLLDWPTIVALGFAFLVMAGPSVGLDIWWRSAGQYLDGSKRVNHSYEVLKAEVLRDLHLDPPAPQPDTQAPVDVAEPAEPAPEAPPEVVETAPTPKKIIARPAPRQLPKTARQRVQTETVLAALGAIGDGPESSFARLTQGAGHVDAFEGIADAALTSDGTDVFALNSGPASTDEIKRLDGDGPARIERVAVKTDSKKAEGETQVRVHLRQPKIDPPPGVPAGYAQLVAAVFSRRKGAMKHCFEVRLGLDEGLAGKVGIRFTIGTAGRITSVSVVADTMGDPEVGRCILGKLRGWRFPRPDGRPATFNHSFIFSAQ